jgi:hypothetical protein
MDDGSRRLAAGRLLPRQIPVQMRGIMALRWTHGLSLDRARTSAPATTPCFFSIENMGSSQMNHSPVPSPAYDGPLDDAHGPMV